ncbi:MAG: hypothetical protein BEN18_00420 [Epulopiscium sp. Nuni2H_MBin001]|nr:MAG: hypothetical protein BEN18_00420 [Epulopiscium sp. Nuni2H_MBin001]
MSVKISVIVPIYNREKYLKECLDSVLSQTLKNIEVICINDGSTDNSQKILEGYQGKDNRIRLFYQENQGAAKARNIGLNIAKGEFIAFMDSDDKYPSNNTLKNMYDNAVNNNVVICGGSMHFLTADGVPRNNRDELNYFKQSGLMEYKNVQCNGGFTRFIYSLDFLNLNNIRFPDYQWGEDPVFLVKVMVCAKVFYALTENTYYYRKGHNYYEFDFQQINDAVRCWTDNLMISKAEKLKFLHTNCLKELNEILKLHLLSSLQQGNVELRELLVKVANCVDVDLLIDYKLGILLNPISDYFMSDYTIIEISKFRELVKSNRYSGYYIYSTSRAAEKTYDIFVEYNIEEKVLGFVDDELELQHNSFLGKPVFNYNMCSHNKDYIFILNRFCLEAKDKLNQDKMCYVVLNI